YVDSAQDPEFDGRCAGGGVYSRQAEGQQDQRRILQHDETEVTEASYVALASLKKAGRCSFTICKLRSPGLFCLATAASLTLQILPSGINKRLLQGQNKKSPCERSACGYVIQRSS